MTGSVVIVAELNGKSNKNLATVRMLSVIR